MDIEYFKNQICEELDGACDYAKNAIELKPMNAAWAKTFFEMAGMEIEHAVNLYKMFEEYVGIYTKAYKEMPAYIEKTRKEIVDLYTDKMVKAKTMLSMYNK